MMNYIKEWGTIVGILGLIGIEISPIKINPITWILRNIGNLLNQDIKKEVSNLSSKVDKLEENQDFTDISNIKQSITNYHALLINSGLDENQYRRCFELEDRYKVYKEKYKGKVNGHLDAMFASIHNNYLKENISLKEVNNAKTKKRT
jgi:hypothetical protein